MTAKSLPAGFQAAGVSCGVKESGSEDLALFFSDRPANSAGVLTRNRVKGAPLIVTRDRLRAGIARAIVVNSGISNVCTGERGIEDAKAMTRVAAEALGAREREVLVASTGVIGPYLPMDKITAGIRKAADGLSRQGGEAAARAIMTTDTVPKAARERFATGRKTAILWGAAKGAGMIHPQMATMLAFVLTDAAIERPLLRHFLRHAVEESFNRITVDGDMSTSDMVLVLANGACGNRAITAAGSASGRTFAQALHRLCGRLAGMLIRDGEGATRFIRVEVEGARDRNEAERIARGVATGNLVKTAIAGGDPNWGRIVARVGQCSMRSRLGKMKVFLGQVCVFDGGKALDYSPRKAQRAVQGKDVLIRIVLSDGKAGADYLTCDLTHDYIRINADYHT
jgi:glutamate N-acetyltransferase/amino-acid N-acetyltransferase